jgi:hypothetical protein
VVVVGAGDAGLAMCHALLRAGLEHGTDFIVVDDGTTADSGGPAGSELRIDTRWHAAVHAVDRDPHGHGLELATSIGRIRARNVIAAVSTGGSLASEERRWLPEAVAGIGRRQGGGKASTVVPGLFVLGTYPADDGRAASFTGIARQAKHIARAVSRRP